MNNIKIIPFRVEHALELKESGIIEGNYWCNFDADAKLAQLLGPGYTAKVDGEIIACAGIRLFWQGVGEAWALFSPKVKDLKLSALRNTRQYLALIIARNELRYVQATPKIDFPAGINFLQHLGFEKKCTLEGYAPDGTDCVLYCLKR